MKLYYAPGACSLASRICLHESGVPATYERVDTKAKRTESGADYLAINPKGVVPALVLDDGELVTENVAILTLLAERDRRLAPDGPLAGIRLIEMLSYLSTELHIAFKPFWHSDSAAEKAKAGELVAKHLLLIESRMKGAFLFGESFTVADAYLFVMLRWARDFGVAIPAGIGIYFAHIAERSTVRTALAEESLPEITVEPAIVIEPI